MKGCWVCILFNIFFSTSVFSAEVIDDIGLSISSNTPIKRIVSLAPDITEILFAIGAQDKLVGVIDGCDYPAEAKKIPSVGAYNGLDLERIIALHPDLIITWGLSFSKQLTVLKKIGIRIYTTQPKKMTDVPLSMMNLGRLIGVEQKAFMAAQKFSQELKQLQQAYANQKPVTVFFQLGSYSLLTINKQSWIHQAIEFCGGRNVFANAFSITSEVGWESVIKANPQVILTDADDHHWKERWLTWKNISAVKQQFLFSIPANEIDRAGPRLVQGVTKICQYLHQVRHHYQRL